MKNYFQEGIEGEHEANKQLPNFYDLINPIIK